MSSAFSETPNRDAEATVAEGVSSSRHAEMQNRNNRVRKKVFFISSIVCTKQHHHLIRAQKAKAQCSVLKIIVGGL